jgi:hypothetical protein
MSLEKQVFIPSVLWHQTKDEVYFTIEVNNIDNENITIAENSFSFSGISNNNNYEINFEYLNNIDNNNSKYVVEQKNIKVTLKKININEYWNSLTKDKNIYKNNIKVNWNAWVDEDDEEENQNPMGNMPFDLQQMMANMGGNMGDYQNMMNNMGEDNNVEGNNVEDDNVEDNNVEDNNVEDTNVEDENLEDENLEETIENFISDADNSEDHECELCQ